MKPKARFWIGTAAGILILLATAVILWENIGQRPSLAEFEKRLRQAAADSSDKSTQEVEKKIVDETLRYYVHAEVPDSLHAALKDSVAVLINTHSVAATRFTIIRDSTNIYEFEQKLRKIRLPLAISLVRRDSTSFRQLFSIARDYAMKMQQGTGNAYWVTHIDQIARFTPAQAQDWLNAKIASELCYKHAFSNYILAQYYATIAFRYLANAPDERIRLDVMNRLQYVLYEFRSLPELSIAFSRQPLRDAIAISSPIQVCGIRFSQGEAFEQNGEIDSALIAFNEVLADANRLKQIADMSWFRQNCLAQIAQLSWQAGDLSQALIKAAEIDLTPSSALERALVHNLHGLINRMLGAYEVAEDEYKIAIHIADSLAIATNQIVFRNNLGLMYLHLTEYDNAETCFQQAWDLIKSNELEQSEHAVNVMIQKIRLLIETRRFSKADSMLQTLSGMTKFLRMQKQENLYRALGDLNSQLGQYDLAVQYYIKSQRELQESGRRRLEMSSKLKLAMTYLLKGDTVSALRLSREILRNISTTRNPEVFIGVNALLAQIEFKAGNLNKSKQHSQAAKNAIKKQARGFKNRQSLIALKQKNYDYLKQFVGYSVANDTLSAFLELAEAKQGLWRSLRDTSTNAQEQQTLLLPLIQAHLDDKTALIDYLTLEDRILAFMLTSDTLFVTSKEVKLDSLRYLVAQHKSHTNEVLKELQKGPHGEPEKPSIQLAEVSHMLFNALPGLDILELSEQFKDLYIVPDDGLYGLPFSTLIIDPNSNEYLVDRIAVSNLVSSAFLAETDSLPKRRTELSKRQVDMVLSIDPRIRQSQELIAFIKKSFPQVRLLTSKKISSKDELLTTLQNPHELLVVIGHAVANLTSPDQSYIQFNAIDESDRKEALIFQVTVEDLRKLDWSIPNMVMLVGCETGMGKLYRGTGLLGLQSAFLDMGAKSVMATQWKIDETEATYQVEDLLEFWLSAPSLRRALQKTQIKSKNRPSRPYPYFWGSLNMFGV